MDADRVIVEWARRDLGNPDIAKVAFAPDAYDALTSVEYWDTNGKHIGWIDCGHEEFNAVIRSLVAFALERAQ